jgi:hypothetical protein
MCSYKFLWASSVFFKPNLIRQTYSLHLELIKAVMKENEMEKMNGYIFQDAIKKFRIADKI